MAWPVRKCRPCDRMGWQHGISGTTRPVAQTTQLGDAAWRVYLGPGTTPAECCPQVAHR
jgi:hypothetical protein